MDIKNLEEKLARIDGELHGLNADLPFREWVSEVFDEIQEDYDFYESRAKAHYLKIFEVKEALTNAVKSAKSNNEHVRKLKSKINEVLERWFQQK
ncbi:hypothetical protein [Kamptonema sp. UHCC 0994]|uniref:hypothetical protein n=1 Tax=Kamptonema sp. UHCC 0994 TaxID=3031329 RepID=UPI0023BA15A1|nr:hypothetical protein [Kamptonema sp. UHCC 0994]MDF0553181.1 hypothetical protein [Kamptonema sp. UHCC 0994]